MRWRALREKACWVRVGALRAKTKRKEEKKKRRGFQWTLSDTCQLHVCQKRVRKADECSVTGEVWGIRPGVWNGIGGGTVYGRRMRNGECAGGEKKKKLVMTGLQCELRLFCGRGLWAEALRKIQFDWMWCKIHQGPVIATVWQRGLFSRTLQRRVDRLATSIQAVYG